MLSHNYRVIWATIAYKKTPDLMGISKALGHKSVKTT